jgi:hypothetical protein
MPNKTSARHRAPGLSRRTAQASHRAAVLAAVIVAAAAAMTPAASARQRTHPAGPSGTGPGTPLRRACPQPASLRWAACQSLVRTGAKGRTGLFTHGAAPSGFGPADLQSAYGLAAAAAGSGPTVAVVDAYGDPKAEADLQIYRRQYGLPVCDTGNGCFEKVNQQGKQGAYPAPDHGWAEEQSLDVDMVSAICPRCHILLVEAVNANVASLGAAMDEAVALGARYVSNSYSTSGEARAETSYDHYYNHPGVAVTASAGDNGYSVSYPAASPYVTSVGGTTLRRDPRVPRGWAETVWGGASSGSGTGSGCSVYEPKPSWQHDAGCARRTVADVSADANPATGVAVYDTYGDPGWQVFGGTSVSSPVIASVYALAGPPAAGTSPASYPYEGALAGPAALNDVTSGGNGRCRPAYLCTAGPGYDGPTGLGTPDGTGAFVHRLTGTIAGKVTSAATGRPVAGARVSAPGLAATTASGGTYRLRLPAAAYQLTVSEYGYQAQTVPVTVTAKAVTTKNITLRLARQETVGGTVRDGSGHGWPLYAKVTWSDRAGHGGTAFTSPLTGRYRLSLLANSRYTLTVASVYPGYQRATRNITVGTSGLTESASLVVDPLACSAPGYHPVTSGATQPFGGGVAVQGTMQAFDGITAPRGWAVRNVTLPYPGYTGRPGWVFDDPGHRGNHTGGTGGFAVVDSGHDGPHHYQDTYLTSPVTDMSGYRSPTLQFLTDLRPAVNSTATVQLSTDAGRTWATVWRESGFPGAPGPAQVVIPLPQTAGQRNVQVRFGYLGEWSQYWEIDNVFLGNRVCARLPGGLLTGRVTAAATGRAINGATVASAAHPRQRAITVPTPGDRAVGGGFYWLFTTTTGTQKFAASKAGYAPATRVTVVRPRQVTSLRFALAASG